MPKNQLTNPIFIGMITATILILFLIPVELGPIYFLLKGSAVIGSIILLNYYQLFSNNNKNGLNLLTHESPIEEKVSFDSEIKYHYSDLLDTIFFTIKSVHKDYIGAVYIYNPHKNLFVLQHSDSNHFRPELERNNEIIASIVKEKSAIILQQKDVKDNWNTVYNEKTWRGSECIIGISINYKNEPVGCILIGIDHFSKIEPRDKRIFSNLGTVFSLGMVTIEKIEQLLSDNYYHSRITSLFSTLKITSNVDELLESIRRMCKNFFRYDKLTISLIEKDSDPIIRLVDGDTNDIMPSISFSQENTLHGLPIISDSTIRSINWNSEYPSISRFGGKENLDISFSAVLGAPIKMDDKNIGSIFLERYEAENFSNSDQKLLEVMASTIGLLLTWIYDYQKMHLSSIHDGLTGLLNRFAFVEMFEKEINRAIRFDQNLVILLFDLDKFKRINDTYGHVYGDHVLKVVSNIIKSNVRNIDIVARYGGEEFVVILVNTESEKSYQVAKRITSKIATEQFHANGDEITMTISAGMAQFPKNSDQIKDLVDKADKAMYYTKKHGGNGVSIYSKNLD